MLDQIQNDLKEAQLARDEIKVSTLRLLISEIKNAEISKGGALSDEDIISVAAKEAKKRVEAAAAFRSGNREDSAQKEELELAVLKSYLPEQLSNEELTKIVEGIIKDTGANNIADMGKVIGLVMSKVHGRADGSTVSSIVREKLSY